MMSSTAGSWSYNVFNVEQTEGIKYPEIETVTNIFTSIEQPPLHPHKIRSVQTRRKSFFHAVQVKKLVSVCASKEFSASAGTLQCQNDFKYALRECCSI